MHFDISVVVLIYHFQRQARESGLKGVTEKATSRAKCAKVGSFNPPTASRTQQMPIAMYPISG